MDWHSLKKEELFKQLGSSEKGISPREAERRLKENGKNEIKESHHFKALKILWSQFNSFLIYILLASIIILISIDFYSNTSEHLVDSIVIAAIIILNATIGFTQQYRAEKAIQNLKKFIIPKSKVLRGGIVMEVYSSKLVQGDIILLGQGDKVPADARILSLKNLQVNEATLTGESEPVTKEVSTLSQKKELAERFNMVFMGTQIVKGTCHAVIVETGMKTFFGEVAGTLQTLKEQKTPMQKRLDIFSKQLGYFTLGMVFLIMVLGSIQGFDKLDMFFIAVTLAIGAIPEGLPAVLAIAFSISASVLSKHNVIIRKLPAIETLGSVTVICSDKTGTITNEQMVVQTYFLDNKFFQINKIKKLSSSLKELIKTSLLCNEARYDLVKSKHEFLGDPTEEALIRSALDLGIDKISLTNEHPTINKLDFDSERKMMSKLRDNGRKNILYTKGAPENVLDACSFEIVNGEIIKLTSKRRESLKKITQTMESKALRVLGFAYKILSKKEGAIEKGLIFQGFIGMQDPPRPEVKKAIKECLSAGISVKMITGDSAETARAIASKVGIKGRLVLQGELDGMSDIELFNSIDEISIFARTTPQQKLRIAQVLQKKGNVVAMTGDGINDILALKSADVGISMGQRGTDVARDVSDIVLVNNNFTSIVEGIRNGRMAYDNIKKFVKYILSVNFSTIFLVGILSMFGLPLPITPLLILWKNIVTDSFPALSLVFEKGEDVMKSKPRSERSILKGIKKFILFGGILNFLACLGVYLITLKILNLSIPEVQTVVATTGILFELFFVYTCRSKKPLGKIGIFSNKWLNVAILTALIIHLLLIYTIIGVPFNVVPLSLNRWLLILPFALSGLVISEILKLFRVRI
jgi:P-type Ca2+ transporter type 2C